MATQRYLKNAPITEAMIDIRAKLPQNFQVKEFIEQREHLSKNYPKVEERHILRGHHEIKNGQPLVHPIEDLGVHGYFFKTDDERNIAQFRIDGFTYNCLKPYTGWESIFGKAQKLWELYKTTASPEAITRLAVRYINHLTIPLPIHDFAEYLEVPPNVPEALPQAVMNFLSRLTIYDTSQDIAANITQTFERINRPTHLDIILDIDVFKQGDFSIEDQEVWKVFETLHEMKNKIFFNSITEKAARLFE